MRSAGMPNGTQVKRKFSGINAYPPSRALPLARCCPSAAASTSRSVLLSKRGSLWRRNRYPAERQISRAAGALVFTAGIGEQAAAIRAAVRDGAAWLGVELDAAANADNRSRISSATSRVAAWAVPTNEELMIARHTSRRIAASELSQVSLWFPERPRVWRG
jgi:hypothetical protein